jgi:hypothetical protein
MSKRAARRVVAFVVALGAGVAIITLGFVLMKNQMMAVASTETVRPMYDTHTNLAITVCLPIFAVADRLINGESIALFLSLVATNTLLWACLIYLGGRFLVSRIVAGDESVA